MCVCGGGGLTTHNLQTAILQIIESHLLPPSKFTLIAGNSEKKCVVNEERRGLTGASTLTAEVLWTESVRQRRQRPATRLIYCRCP